MKDLARIVVGFVALCGGFVVVAVISIGVGFLLPGSMYMYGISDSSIFARLEIGFLFAFAGTSAFLLILLSSYLIGSSIFKD